MRVGIIAEGRSDFAVVANILEGKLGIPRHKLTALRPRFALDETDRANHAANGRGTPHPDEFGNYAIVLEECSPPHEKLLDFLEIQIAEPRFVAVHIDTDKCDTPEFGVTRPAKKPKDAGERYPSTLRDRVAAKLEMLLGPELRGQVCFAIAVEETEAWLLTLWDPADPRDTGLRGDPKKYFYEKVVADRARKPAPRARAGGEKEHEYSDFLSAGFRDGAVLAACGERNRSLGLFLEELARFSPSVAAPGSAPDVPGP